MPSGGHTSDAIIDTFYEMGYPADEAIIMATEYIAEGRFDSTDAFAQRYEAREVEYDEKAFICTDAAIHLNKMKKEYGDEAPNIFGYETYKKIHEDCKKESLYDEGDLEVEGQESIYEELANIDGKRKYNIGAEFDGLTTILEYEDENMYIPDSSYCLFKCIEKYTGLTISTISASPYGISIRKVRSVLKKNKMDPELYIPIIFRPVVQDDEIVFERVSTSQRTKIPISTKIYLFPFFMDKHISYHAVLGYKKLTYEMIRSKLSFGKRTALSITAFRIPMITMADPKRLIWVYDIETYKDGKTLVPFGAAYQLIDLKDQIQFPVQHSVGEDCLEKMLEVLQELGKCSELKEIHCFAHNGGRFDHLYIKACRNIKLISEYGSSGGIRIMKGQVGDDLSLIFKDSFAFVLLSLKNACKAFKIEDGKLDFDIAAMTKEKMMNSTEWITYMERDVTCLGEIMKKVEEYLIDINQSVTTNSSISTVAWRDLFLNSDFHFPELRLPKDPTTQMFIREAAYGGRVQHFKKRYEGNDMICIDANSLYPSAMVKGTYPVGPFEVFKSNVTLEAVLRKLKDGIMMIIEVTLRVKTKKGIIPYRTPKRSLIYPTGTFRGVYTSVELLEALHEGYQIIEFHRGIYWWRSTKLFSRIVTSLYEKRKKLKAEGNPLEHMVKIQLNSMYGKMLETPKSSILFSYYDNEAIEGKKIKMMKLKNSQYQYKIKENLYSKKPVYLAAFILSYSRRIMNEAIRRIGIENIWYGDTDSLYTTRDNLDKIELSNDLGGFKNDYGDDLIITKAIFLDLKRYFLKFNNGTFKAKFLGLNFRSSKITSNDISDVTDEIDKVERLYEDLYRNSNSQNWNIVAEKWFRTFDCVSIVDTEMQFQIDGTVRGRWLDPNDASAPIVGEEPPGPYITHPKESLKWDETLRQPYRISDKTGITSTRPLNFRNVNRTMKGKVSNFIYANKKIMRVIQNQMYNVNSNGPYGPAVDQKIVKSIITLSDGLGVKTDLIEENDMKIITSTLSKFASR
jgi:hypothetical protein